MRTSRPTSPLLSKPGDISLEVKGADMSLKRDQNPASGGSAEVFSRCVWMDAWSQLVTLSNSLSALVCEKTGKSYASALRTIRDGDIAMQHETSIWPS